MDLKQQILHYYRVDEMSLREIARRTGVDRKTVTRLISAYEAAIKADVIGNFVSPNFRKVNSPV